VSHTDVLYEQWLCFPAVWWCFLSEYS
jgi:hypothetical protein